MYFTNKAYYTGENFIPNLIEECDNLDFFGFEAEMEEECLRAVLGGLYDVLITQLEWDETDNVYKIVDGADVKWSRLINGHDYLSTDIVDYYGSYDNYTWKGFTQVLDRRIKPTTVNGQTANGIKVYKSFISDYVYYKWSLKTDTFTASTGEKTSDVKNTFQASNSDKRTHAYNRFVSKVAGYYSNNVSLYTYLTHFKSLFPEWEGKLLKYEPIW